MTWSLWTLSFEEVKRLYDRAQKRLSKLPNRTVYPKGAGHRRHGPKGKGAR